MTKEERVAEICKQCHAMLGESLANAIAHAISEGYKLGLEEAKKIYEPEDYRSIDPNFGKPIKDRT